MAGFGTVVTHAFHDVFPGRVLNTHPSLLPHFKGWHAVRDALAAGVGETGCTVHVATEALDDGPILAQRVVTILDGDTEESLHERIKEVERSLYPHVLEAVIAAIEAALAAAVKPLPTNVDGALAALLYDMGFPPDAGKLIFMVGRIAGLTAEVAEEHAREKPMRVKIPVVYDGEPPRDLP